MCKEAEIGCRRPVFPATAGAHVEAADAHLPSREARTVTPQPMPLLTAREPGEAPIRFFHQDPRANLSAAESSRTPRAELADVPEGTVSALPQPVF